MKWLVTLLLTVQCTLMALGSSSSAAIQDTYPPTQRREQGTAWRLSGSIQSSLGVVIPNGELYCIRAADAGSKAQLWQYIEFEPVAGDTGLNGGFQIQVSENRFLYATGLGHAPSIVQVPEGNQLDVELNQGRSIAGKIVLPSGRPALGASVQPLFVMPNYISVSEEGTTTAARRLLRLPDAGRDWKTVVSSTGEFSMSRLPEEMPVGVLVSLPGYREELIWVTHDGESLNVDGSEFVVDDQFEHQLAPCPKLVLSGQRDEDMGSQRIGRVLVEQLREGVAGTRQAKNSLPNGRWLDVNPNQKIEFSLDSDSHAYAIWVEPEGTDRLGIRFEVAKGSIEKLLERTVSFPIGAQVKGQLLNEQTAEPIEGGTICWFDSDQRCVASDGTFPRLNVGANKDGHFEIAVPKEDGVIGVVGGIKGFQSLKNFLLMPFAKETVRTRFMRSISEANLADGLFVEFRLEPSLTAKIKVLRPDGLPAGQAVVSGYAVQIPPTGPSIFAAFPKAITLEADGDGSVLLSDWYNSAVHVASARGELASEKEVELGFFNGKQHPFVDARLARYPTRFEGFSSNGLWQGNVTVPIPDPSENTNGQEPEVLILQLRNGSTIDGQVVNERGKGVANLMVSAVSSETIFNTTVNGQQVWTTRTRDDGKFRIVGVTPLRDYEITLGKRNVKLLTGVVSLNGKSSLLPNAVFELPRVECVDMRVLDESFPEINIAGMKQVEAVEVVGRFLERQLQRIPEIPNRFKDVTGRSGGDPVPAFLDRLVEKVLPICKKTAALAPGSKAELQLLNYLQLITNLEPHAYPGAGVKQTRDFMLDRILRHHNQDPVVQPLLLRIAQRGDKWQRLMEDAKSQETQQFAGEQFVGRKLDQLVSNTARIDPFERFDRDWAQLKPMLKQLGGIIKNNKRTDRIDRFRSRVEEWRKWAHKTMKGLPKAEAASAALKVDRLFEELDAWLEEHSNR